MGTELAMRGVEAQMAIGEGIAMLMFGGSKARKEARRKVTETLLSAGSAAVTLAADGSPRKVVRGYRATAQDNHRRPSKD